MSSATETGAGKPFQYWGLSKSEVQKHFKEGDEVAVWTSTSRRSVSVFSERGYVGRARLLSTAPHFDQMHSKSYLSRTDAVVPTEKSWQTAGVGFMVEPLGDDGESVPGGRVFTVKTVFGSWEDFVVAKEINDQRVAENLAASQAFQARVSTLATKIADALEEKGIRTNMWSEWDRHRGIAPRLGIGDIGRLLGLDVDDDIR